MRGLGKIFGILALLSLACAAKPSIIPASKWGSEPKVFPQSMAQTPKVLVIHHAGVSWKPGSDPVQKLRDLQKWGQREKGWLDVPYHYLLTPDGQIFEGRDWHFQPDSNTDYPLNGVLNVELFGNFEVDTVSQQQLESLVEILAFLCKFHHLSEADLTSHLQMAPGQTSCPGKDLQALLDGPLKPWVRQKILNDDFRPGFWMMGKPQGRL